MTQQDGNTHKLAQFISFIKVFGLLTILVDAAINTGYIVSGRATDGLSPTDILLGIAFFCIWAMATTALMMLGLDMLPQANKHKRLKTIPLWASAMILVGGISTYMSVAQLGGDLARQEYSAKVIHRTNNNAEDMIELQRLGNNVQAILRGAKASISALYEAELQGTICETGSGQGRCTGLLKNLLDSTDANLKQLIALNGEADPIIESIRELQSDMHWLGRQNNDEIDHEEKMIILRERLNLMAQQIEALSQTLPLLPISRAMDSYNRNWASLGISEIGAKRIQTEVRPIAKRLKPIQAKLKAASHIRIRGLNYKSEYELLANATSVRPIIGIAFLLAFLPILLSSCVLILTGREGKAKQFNIADLPTQQQTRH